MRLAENSRSGVVANYRSISHSEALTFRETTDEFGTSWVMYCGVPEILGRLLHGIYEACGKGMRENGGSAKETRCPATPKCGNVHPLPRALPIREKIPDRSSSGGLTDSEPLLCGQIIALSSGTHPSFGTPARVVRDEMIQVAHERSNTPRHQFTPRGATHYNILVFSPHSLQFRSPPVLQKRDPSRQHHPRIYSLTGSSFSGAKPQENPIWFESFKAHRGRTSSC